MRLPLWSMGVWLLAAAALCLPGCTPEESQARRQPPASQPATVTSRPQVASAPTTTAASPWVVLFDGDDMRRWRTVQGNAKCENGAMILDGRRGDTTVIARRLHLRNGTVEVELRRQPPDANDGPYTVGLRLPARITWRSVYFVCRRESLEACRASWLKRFPQPEKQVRLERAPGRKLWRFVMNEGVIHCYRDGEKVLTYDDADPRTGTIGLTASRCRIEVRSIRYRPAANGP